jgi:hypothetical protein
MDKVVLPPERVQELLGELCVKLGFCLHSVAQHRIANSPPSTIDRFTDVVFSEEVMDHRYTPKLREQVREVVARYFDAQSNAT